MRTLRYLNAVEWCRSAHSGNEELRSWVTVLRNGNVGIPSLNGGMNSTAALLEKVVAELEGSVRSGALAEPSDVERIELLQSTGAGTADGRFSRRQVHRNQL